MICTFFSAVDGVGKSTLCVHLAHALAKSGKRTLLIDLSPSAPALDILCGVAEGVVYTVSDAVGGPASPERVLLEVILHGASKKTPPFLFAPIAPLDAPHEMNLAAGIKALAKAAEAEIVLIDADLAYYDALYALADTRLLLTDTRESSLRASEALSAHSFGIDRPFDRFVLMKESSLREIAQKHTPPIDLVDRLSLPILGITFADTAVEDLSLCVHKRYQKQNYPRAVGNLALRLLGEKVPLLDGIRLEGMSRRFYLERSAQK